MMRTMADDDPTSSPSTQKCYSKDRLNEALALETVVEMRVEVQMMLPNLVGALSCCVCWPPAFYNFRITKAIVTIRVTSGFSKSWMCK